MWAIGALVRREAETLAALESAQSGKPIRDARAEAARVAEMAEYWAGWCDKIEGRTVPVPSGHTVIIRREPYGVVVAVTPWNAPLFTAGWNVFPALAAGNAVVLKPSEFTPLTSLVLGGCASRPGCRRAWCRWSAGRGRGRAPRCWPPPRSRALPSWAARPRVRRSPRLRGAHHPLRAGTGRQVGQHRV